MGLEFLLVVRLLLVNRCEVALVVVALQLCALGACEMQHNVDYAKLLIMQSAFF